MRDVTDLPSVDLREPDRTAQIMTGLTAHGITVFHGPVGRDDLLRVARSLMTIRLHPGDSDGVTRIARRLAPVDRNQRRRPDRRRTVAAHRGNSRRAATGHPDVGLYPTGPQRWAQSSGRRSRSLCGDRPDQPRHARGVVSTPLGLLRRGTLPPRPGLRTDLARPGHRPAAFRRACPLLADARAVPRQAAHTGTAAGYRDRPCARATATSCSTADGYTAEPDSSATAKCCASSATRCPTPSYRTASNQRWHGRRPCQPTDRSHSPTRSPSRPTACSPPTRPGAPSREGICPGRGCRRRRCQPRDPAVCRPLYRRRHPAGPRPARQDAAGAQPGHVLGHVRRPGRVTAAMSTR